MARKFFTGIDLQNNRGINFASPSTSTDGVNKAYVDNLVNGLSWKTAVQAATTTNASLTTAYVAGQVIDGYTLVLNDRILLKNQTTASQNGIVTVNASGAPSTPPDAATGEISTNATVRVNNGTVNVDTAWTLTTVGTITAGSTSQTWAQSNAGTPYSAGNGLTLTSTTFSVNAGLGLLASGSQTTIDTTVVARKYAVSIGDGSTTIYTVTHNLGTLDVQSTVYNNSTGEVVEADIIHNTTNTITVGFAAAPASSAYRVAVVG
jgi:hypothetical protein